MTGRPWHNRQWIICACDSFSAMTTDRSYRRAMALGEALAELRRCSGEQFDAQVVEALEGVALQRHERGVTPKPPALEVVLAAVV